MICLSERNQERSYHPVIASLLDDASLTWEAKGFMMSIPVFTENPSIPVDESLVNFNEILKTSKDGTSRFLTILKELRKKGILKEAPRTGHVYLLKSEWSGFYKIGFTTELSVKLRMKSLRTGDPSIIFVDSSEAGKNHEKKLHSMFKHRSLKGDWFNLTPDDVIAVQSYLNGLNQTMDDAKSR